MRIMIDTNVFISALLSKNSTCHKIIDIVTNKHELVLCDYIISECYDVANRKFPSQIKVLDEIFAKLRYELVFAPRVTVVKIADVNDQPILNAAIEYGIDILISGDRHFLALKLETLEILAPSNFLTKII